MTDEEFLSATNPLKTRAEMLRAKGLRCRCGNEKDADWHLVCQECWERIPTELQQRLYGEYRKECGSESHNLVIREIYRQLGRRGAK